MGKKKLGSSKKTSFSKHKFGACQKIGIISNEDDVHGSAALAKMISKSIQKNIISIACLPLEIRILFFRSIHTFLVILSTALLTK